MLAILLLLLARAPQGDAGPARSMVLHDEGYVGSEACADCHATNHASWKASFHRTMTQAPSGAAVQAPFEGTTPALEGVAWKLARSEDAFLATPVSPEGETLGPPARVALTTGSHHYQIYWLVSPVSTRLIQMPLVWHVGAAAWVPRKAMFLIPPGPTGPETDRWQEVCIKCHTTNGTPNHPDGGAARVAELGIACEACHGPAGPHVAWRRSPDARDSSGPHETDPIDPRALDPARASQICGQCHGIHPLVSAEARQAWQHDGFAYRPGQDLAETRTLLRGRVAENTEALRAFLGRNPETLSELFWSDGEVRVSGREYNGLVDSPCFRGEGERRLSCLSCHELHASAERVAAGWPSDQLRAGRDGPAACLDCHPALAAPEARAAHTHHAPGSSGDDCLNCHMPYTTYGLTKAIRSHRISSPSVASSLATGRPNACNQCHLDRTLAWTAQALSEWTGAQVPELDRDQREVAASVLWTLTGDAGQRALLAWSLAWEPARAASGTEWMPYLISTLLLDEYDAVRWIAARAARRLPGRADFRLDPCAELEDQRNAVRESILSDWLRDGLGARPGQGPAVLVRPDGTLDEARFRTLYGRRDTRPVRLAE